MTFTRTEVAAPEAADALGRYFDELAARFPGGYDVAAATAEVSSLLDPPHGEFVLARSDGRVVGCGGIRFLGGATAEVRRMWVDPRARGRGVGRALLAHLETRAAAAGCTSVVLDTHAALVEAQSLYRATGYVPIDPYNDNPSAHYWFRKALNGPS